MTSHFEGPSPLCSKRVTLFMDEGVASSAIYWDTQIYCTVASYQNLNWNKDLYQLLRITYKETYIRAKIILKLFIGYTKSNITFIIILYSNVCNSFECLNNVYTIA